MFVDLFERIVFVLRTTVFLCFYLCSFVSTFCVLGYAGLLGK